MVALTLLFLPWSTIRPGLSGGGGNAGSGVGAAPPGPGSALNAQVGRPTLGVVAIAQPLAVTRAVTGSGPIGPTGNPKPKHPVIPIVQFPTNHTGHKHRDRGWPDGHQNDGDGDQGHQGNGGHGNGNGGHGNGNGGHGNGNGGGWGGSHDGDHQGHHEGGQHQSGHHQGGNHGHGGWGHDAARNGHHHGNGAVLILA